MAEDASLYYAALHRSCRFNDGQFRALLSACAEPQAWFELDAPALEALGLPKNTRQCLRDLQQAVDSGRVEQYWQPLQRAGIGVITLTQDEYPALLREIYDPPPFLYYRGSLQLLQRPMLAMVGSRRSSRQGADNAFQFAASLAQAGMVICSGMAAGIDGHSHRGALSVAVEPAATIAVLGTGIDVVYPREHRQLYDEIAERGLLLSECWPGAGPRRHQFPKRNRIISGLSLGVLVVEAALKSGSLISARCAMEQGREVFAIPGSIHNPASRGCHQLIRSGAALVETVEQLLEELAGWLPTAGAVAATGSREPQQLSLLPEEAELLAAMGFDPVTVDQLCTQLPLSTPEITAALMKLELLGAIENIAGNYQRIRA